jgi:uncharacterized protein with von Willebrand factor type A (vWA) domain
MIFPSSRRGKSSQSLLVMSKVNGSLAEFCAETLTITASDHVFQVLHRTFSFLGKLCAVSSCVREPAKIVSGLCRRQNEIRDGFGPTLWILREKNAATTHDISIN